MIIIIKKIIPRVILNKIRPIYHYILGFFAALVYGFPSQRMIVVGVTGTTGKTTVVYMIAHALRSAGFTVGYTSTAMFSDGKKDWLNDKKMTMIGRFFTQKILRTMLKNKCDIAIVETTSEGAVQYRHRFINYDMMVFTGLYPEHIESHGSFDNYKNAKRSVFSHIAKCAHKIIDGKKIEKSIIINCDDEHAGDFMDFPVDRIIGFTTGQNCPSQCTECVIFSDTVATARGVRFVFNERNVQLRIMGNFNALNATAAGSACRAIGMSDAQIVKGLEKIDHLPGRIERITEGQDFTVIVDYAFEPVAVTRLYETIEILRPQHIIHVLGSTGGGRDVARRAALGKIVGQKADYVIVTNEDPYDDDPLEIMHAVANGAQEMGKTIDTDLFVIEDRKKAIEKALLLAQRGDVVLITGKGSEQAIVGKNGKLIPWDDRTVVRSLLKNGFMK